MMAYPYYKRQVESPLAEVPDDLTLPRPADLDAPKNYLPDEGLVAAVNVALLLGQPLLLTGEPGTGKTHLARSISWQLGFKEPSPLIFETKSTSTARDLFYTYDTVGRFHAAQTKRGAQDSRAYITYNALGKAILLANELNDVEDYLPLIRKRAAEDPGKTIALGDVSHSDTSDDQFEIDRELFKHGGNRRSVVLIDEIDKAPRDFPNDILNEVENMYFRVPELGNVTIRAPEGGPRPVLILTSNSEKNLPDAFLRRCVYYSIPFPDEHLGEIIEARLGAITTVMNDALALFRMLRAPDSQLIKKPATAELLDWLRAIQRLCKSHEISEDRAGLLKKNVDKLIEPTIGVLVKNEADRNPARAIVQEWQMKK